MDRRDFLRTTTLATVAVAGSGPLILGADDKAGNKRPTVGKGEFTYECYHDWGQLPSGFSWQTTHGTAVDSEGLVYITHQGVGPGQLDTVLVFDAEGKFVHSFGKQWKGGGHGIDIRKEADGEFLYLAHMSADGPVVKCDKKGEIVWQKGPPAESMKYEPKKDAKGKAGKPPYRPTNVAFLPDGGFYVGDGYGSHYVHRYDAKGEWQQTIGGVGKEPGQFRTPHGNWVDQRGDTPLLVVCDRANARLQWFKTDGEFVGMSEAGTVLFPAHIDIREDVMLVPDLHARISLLNKKMEPIVHLGDDADWRAKVLDGFKIRTEPKSWQPGKFVHPHDACFDADGNIYVAEWVSTGRVSFLKKVG